MARRRCARRPAPVAIGPGSRTDRGSVIRPASSRNNTARVRRSVRAILAIRTTWLPFCWRCSHSSLCRATRRIESGETDESTVVSRGAGHRIDELCRFPHKARSPARPTPSITARDWQGGTTHEKAASLFSWPPATALFSPALHADDYPSKPITLVAVFGPGSASDTICRVVAQPLGVALKQTVIVENRPGANGALAALYVARSAPDGYTLLMGTNSPLSAVPFMMKNVSYDPMKDFTPVTRMGSFTLMLVVHPSIPAQNGQGADRLCQGQSRQTLVCQRQHLRHRRRRDAQALGRNRHAARPYKSSPPALQDVLAGRVSMMFTDLTTGLPHVKSGALRALAVTRIQRSSLFPSCPRWTRPELKASTWIPGPASSRRPIRRRRS